jgi:hypothetical protein
MQESMAEVAVGESVGASLEPNNDGVHFTDGANAWMVDVIVDNVGRNYKIERRIDSVAQGYDSPCEIEAASSFLLLFWCIMALVSLLHACKSTLGLRYSDKLDPISDKEMAWNEEVEEEAVYDILAPIVVAAQAYENSILLLISNCTALVHVRWYLSEVLDHESEIREDCVGVRVCPGWVGEGYVLSTRTIRFRKPTKLGLSSASWLRHELCSSECVAKTCRYFVSRMRWAVLLTLGSLVFSLYLLRRLATGTSVLVCMSVLVWMAVSTMVAIEAAL